MTVLRTTLENMRTTKRTEIQSRFTCKFCHKVFVLEDRYLAHKCKQMKRDEEFRTPVGQQAWHYYQLWMRSMKRMPPPAGSFLSSKYYRTFINFTNFTKRVDLPRPERFIQLMVKREYPPTIWMNDEVYAIYLEYMDYQTSPVEQATLSIQTLIDYTDKREIDLATVFEVMTISEIIHYLHVRKLSPWLLLFSKTFKHALVNKATDEQRIMMENLIRPEYWPDRFANSPADVATIKKLVAEMGI